MSESASLSSGIWERTGTSTISRRLFMFLYGIFTLLGLAATAVTANYAMGIWTAPAGPETAAVVYTGPSILIVAIGSLVVSIIGIIIASKSNNPLVSFFGYMLVAMPFGFLLGPLVATYTAASVVKVVFVTASIVGVFAIIGAIIPNSLESWGAWLFGGLLILLIGQFGIPFAGWLIPGFPLTGALRAWDWFGVILFSAYVIFDVNRAMRVPATFDNAIDCALALYLDILNLFIRLLQIMGQKKN